MGRAEACDYETERPDESRYQATKREVQRLRAENDELRAAIVVLKTQATLNPSLPKASAASDLPYRAVHCSPAAVFLETSLATLRTYLSVLPPAESLVEFELSVLHQHAYPSLPPVLDPQALAEELFSDEHRTKADQQLLSCLLTNLDPTLPASYCDPRLQYLSISHWTSVPIPDAKAAVYISLYLERLHPVLGCFHADLFVRDLVEQREDYCSSSLVHAVLAMGCQVARTVDAVSSLLEAQLQAGFARLVAEDYQETNQLTFVAALLMQAYAQAFRAQTGRATAAMRKCHSIASSEGLTQASLHKEDVNPDEGRYMAHVIWGHFVTTTLFDFFYEQCTPLHRPAYAVPGSIGFALPEYMGDTFHFVCSLALLMRDVVEMYFSPVILQHDSALLSQWIGHTYDGMLKWSDRLSALSQRSIDPSMHTLILHIWFHNLVMGLVRPWKGQGLHLQTRLSTACTPEAIDAASLRQLKSLMLKVMSTCPQAYTDAPWHTVLYIVANAAIADSAAPESTFFFRLALTGYMRLGLRYPIARLVALGLLEMGRRAGLLPPEEVALVAHNVRQTQGPEQADTEHVVAFPIQVDTPFRASDNTQNMVSSLVLELEAAVLGGSGQ